MNTIKVNPELIDNIENSSKRATTRLGLKTKYTLGPVNFVNSINEDDVIDGYDIYKIESLAFCELTEELATEEGFNNLNDFRNKLIEIYGTIDDYATMTVIYWDK